jgi:hypothetical protein
MPKVSVRSREYAVVNLKTQKEMWVNLREDFFLYKFSRSQDTNLALFSKIHCMGPTNREITAKWLSPTSFLYNPLDKGAHQVASFIVQQTLDENVKVNVYASENLSMTEAELELLAAIKKM